MSKFEETVTADFARITCDHCGNQITSYDGMYELEKDAAICGWEFCHHDEDANELEILQDDYRQADLHFCSPECLEKWIVENDCKHAITHGS